MKNLRKKFELFCYRNHNKGIPNLMLYIVLGCGFVSALTILGYPQVYQFLCFDREKILQGQVWRLITYVFTLYGGNILTTLIVLYCAYSLGRTVENTWGTCKFTLFYLFNIVVMDAFAMLFGGVTYLYAPQDGVAGWYASGIPGFYEGYIGTFLHLIMVICFATLYPDAQFLVLYIVPIKAKLLSLFYLAYMLFEVLSLTVNVMYFPHNLFPLVAMLGYFLFFGSDVKNLLPLSWQAKLRKKPKKARPASSAEPIRFRAKEAKKEADYNHRCTVCGRTDVTNPELEFRYCSRCKGYYCYCEDHISNHAHIE